MTSLNVQVEHISASCNCTYNSFELTDKFIVFGSQNALAVYDLLEEKVVKTYAAHKGRINCVRYLKEKDEKWILTCATDGNLIIWYQEDCFESDLNPKCVYKACDVAITVSDGLGITEEKVLVGCISALSKVYLYNVNLVDNTFVLIQEINLKLSVALDLIFHRIPDSNDVILSFGMDNGSVILYGCSAKGEITLENPFKEESVFKKHEDWVRCISFFNLENGDTLMATGGEDSFIAIWRFTKASSEVNEFEFQVHHFGSSVIVFESIIMGHEGWITSLHWNSQGELISCSSDQSIIIWENGENMWMEKNRFGTIGGQIPGGFGAKFNLSHVAVGGHQGAIQIWENVEEANWQLKPSITGHFGPISDLDYNSSGQFIITTSEDQTTRAHSPWGLGRWHEISRPQIHGHDLFTAKILDDYIISGAEEKILRAFQPTDIFAKNLADASELPSVDFLKHIAPAATLPALGLSNLSEGDRTSALEAFETDLPLESRLDEDFLRTHTLWPEVSKLYGHVYEIRCIATSPVDPLITSSSQASRKEYSGIILWSSENWKKIGEFIHHNLNVTDMEFSSNGDWLLSASRDRTWALWGVVREAHQPYNLELLETGSFHTRALWVCTWHPQNNFFLTGARDKKLAVWTKNTESNKYQLLAHESFPVSVSAAATNEDNVISVGLENGLIFFYMCNLNPETSGKHLLFLIKLDNSLGHHSIVKRLKYNPKEKYQLASAGADHIFKVYQMQYNFDS